ncbi:hypothetical protein E4U52_006789 [Claviceps spartinae]|nr:hypothetical protein E4U52_006789 [Claviceps spartinae]
MNTTALSDVQKLADAIALAKSFKTGQNSKVARNKSEPSRQARKTDSIRSLTPKSRQNGEALQKVLQKALQSGQSSRSGSPKIPAMSSAMDFLRRVDRAPATSAAMDSRTTSRVVNTSFNSPGSLSTADPGAPPPARKQEPQITQSLVAVRDEHVTEDTSGPLLQIFLTLLAEQIDLPPYLQELRDCAKKSKTIDGASSDGELEPHQQGSESRRSMPEKKSQLRFNAPAFVPTGSQDWNVAHDCEDEL